MARSHLAQGPTAPAHLSLTVLAMIRRHEWAPARRSLCSRDVLAELSDFNNEVLNIVADRTNEPVTTMRNAMHVCRRRHVDMPKQLIKTLCNLDLALKVIRHVTRPQLSQTIEKVKAAIPDLSAVSPASPSVARDAGVTTNSMQLALDEAFRRDKEKRDEEEKRVLATIRDQLNALTASIADHRAETKRHVHDVVSKCLDDLADRQAGHRPVSAAVFGAGAAGPPAAPSEGTIMRHSDTDVDYDIQTSSSIATTNALMPSAGATDTEFAIGMKFRRYQDDTKYLHIIRDDRQRRRRHARGWRLSEYVDGRTNGQGRHMTDEQRHESILNGLLIPAPFV